MVDAHGVVVRRMRLEPLCGLFILSTFLPGSSAVRAEPTSRLDQINAGLDSTRIYRNYAGDFIMRFPNYDFRLLGPARRQVVEGGFQQGPIVFRNDERMFWDGSSLLLHPAYPSRMLTRFRFELTVVGRPLGTRWPYLDDEISVGPHREAVQFTPPVAFRPLSPDAPSMIPLPESDGTLKFWLPNLDSSLEKGTDQLADRRSSRIISLPPKRTIVPQRRYPPPTTSIPTKPVSTIRVHPWAPRAFQHPVHDSLGTFSQIPFAAP